MRTSISHLKTHLVCPQLAHYQHVALRGRGRAKALEIGTWVHQALAKKMGATVEIKEAVFPEDWRKEVESAMASVEEWKVPEDWEVHAVEMEGSLTLGRHEVVGTLDAVVKWNGMFWHVQHKTLAATVPLDTYAELIRYDWHEVVYQKMAEEMGFQPFGGTILNVIKKRVPKGESPFFTFYLMREERVMAEALKDITKVMGEIESQYIYQKETAARLGEIGMLPIVPMESIMSNARIVKNRSACAGPYRNSLCKYHAVCGGEASIDDDSLFDDMEARYAKTKED